MDKISAAIALKALDGLTTRSEATAQNIANALTPGYRPLRVNFEAALMSAAKEGIGAIEDVQPQIEAYGAPNGINIPLELATTSSTAIRYAALVEVLNRQLQLDGLVLSGKN